MSASIPGEDSTLGERLRFAIAAENRTETGTNTALFPTFGKGDISSLCTGRRGTSTVDPRKMKILADFLHVRLEWLLVGTMPMRRDGRTEKTAAEYALSVARTFDIREDAWQIVWDRNKDRQSELSAEDWFNAIRAEADRLERARVPRPDVIKQGQIAWTDEKKRRARKPRTTPTPAPPTLAKRVAAK